MRLTRRQMLGLLAGVGVQTAGVPLFTGKAAAHCKPTIVPWRNWSGAQTCIPSHRVAPGDEFELADLLKTTTDSIVRPVGAGHSFSGLVPTDGKMVSLARLDGLVNVDAKAQTAEFYAGTRLSETGAVLKKNGLAFENMPDIDYQSLGGLLATSTHGTGIGFGSMSSLVEGFTLVTPEGEILECDADNNAEVFRAGRVSLGALGVLAKVRLRCRSPFRVHERIWIRKLDELLGDIDRLVSDNERFEAYAIPNSDFGLAISINETSQPEDEKGAADDEGDNSYVTLIQKLDKYGSDFPSVHRAILNLIVRFAGEENRVGESYRMFANSRTIRFNEMEYQVPAERGPDCLREIVRTIKERRLATWFPIEYRYVKGDDIPLSQFEGRDSASISIHQHYQMDYHNYFAAIEPIFWKYGGRPHWGKLHTLNAHVLAKLYPRWEEFASLRKRLDPKGKFLNAHLSQILGVKPALS